MRIINTGILAVVLAITIPVQAAWYQVEVIVFEHLRPDLAQEVWFENPGLPAKRDTIELITEQPESVDFYHVNNPEPVIDPDKEVDPEEGLIPYLALDASRFRLSNDYRILRLSAEYRPLTHLAWQQPGYDHSDGRAIHLEGLLEDDIQIEDLPPELADIQIIEEIYQPPGLSFDGTVRLRASQFLHLEIDMAFFPENIQQTLLYQKQSSPDSDRLVINPESDYVRLIENRRVRLNELNYFDHPLFGVLVQVSRLQIPDN